MLIYIFIIVITFILTILSIDKNANKISILWSSIILFVLLSFFAGFRLIGFDYDNYLIHFLACPNIFNYYRVMPSMEIGYELFVSLCKTISPSFHFFLFIFTSLSILITLKLCYKYSPYPLLSFIMFFAYSFFTQVMGQMRQPIAISIIYLLIIPLILKVKYRTAYLLVILGGIILHKSLFFLLFGLLIRDRILSKKNIYYLIFISLGCYLTSTILVNILPSIIPQGFYLYDIAIGYLSDKSYTKVFTMGMIERSAMCFVILYYTKKYDLYKLKLLRLFTNFYFVGVCLYFATISISAEFASRGTQVLSYSLFFILPIIYKNIKLKDKKRLLIIILLWSFYLSLSFIKSLDTYIPYKHVYSI